MDFNQIYELQFMKFQFLGTKAYQKKYRLGFILNISIPIESYYFILCKLFAPEKEKHKSQYKTTNLIQALKKST